MWVGSVLFWQDVLQPCFPHKWASSATPASFCSSRNLSSLPVELSSRQGVNTGPWALIPKPLCFKSQNSDSTNLLCIHLSGCSRSSSHIVSTCLGYDRGIKTSGGQFLRKDIQNIRWHLPHMHTPIHALACRHRQEHMCTTPYTQMHLHTHFYTHVNQCRKRKHAHRNLSFCGTLWWCWHWWLSWRSHFEKQWLIQGSRLSENEPGRRVGTIGREAWVASHLDKRLVLCCEMNLDNAGSLFETQFPHL